MNECLIWASLSDKAALGEPLTAEERLYLRSHSSGCSACATEASLWEDLGCVLEEPARLTSCPSGFEQSAAATSHGGLRSVPRRVWSSLRHRPLLAATAVISAAAASAALLSWPSEGAVIERGRASVGSSGKPRSALTNGLGARMALAAGETSVNGQAASAGQPLAPGAVISVAVGQACVLVPPGVSVCLDQGSELAVEKLDAGVRRFRLQAGHVVAHLDRQPAGASFGFETPAGPVVAKGTVFSLQTDGSTVTLRVHEGTVLNSRGAATSAYQAPSTALLSQERPVHVSDDVSSADARLVELAKYFSERSSGTLRVTAATGSGVALDDFPLGMAPISALLRPGSYRMQVSRPGFAPIVERLTLEPGSSLTRAYEATSELGAAADESSAVRRRGFAPHEASAPPAAVRTPGLLLKQARELRAAGRYQEANVVYQRLLREHAASSEARVALVSLGELQLSQLGDASGALRSFEAYLRAGGALRQEAHYGRIRALRQLGRVSEARVATDAFVRDYPNSVQAATLRKEAP